MTLLLCALLLPVPALAQDITTGLIGHWKLDETSGGTITDYGSGGNNGTWDDNDNDDVTEETNAGKISKSLAFDGTDDFVSVGNPALLENMTTLSASMWIRPNALNAATCSGAIVLIQKSETCNSATDGWIFFLNSTGALEFREDRFTSELIRRTNAGLITPGQWYHVTATWNGGLTAATDVHIYINGEEAGYAFSQNGAGFDQPTTDGMEIGGTLTQWGPPPSGLFDGLLDDVRLYNRALTPEDVAALYEYRNPGSIRYNADYRVPEYFDEAQWIAMGPPKPTSTGLVGHWKLDETSGTLADSSGNGNDGTQSGGIQYASSGKIGYAAGFDGVDDYINFGDFSEIEGVNAFSVSAWVKNNKTFIDASGYELILNKIGGGTDTFRMQWSQNEDIEFSVYDSVNTSQMALFTDGIPDGAGQQWHHVAGVYDGSNVYVYVNGVQGGTVGSMTGPTNNTAHNLEIAADASDGWDGLIDDVRVYNRALSAAEIADLYDQGNTHFQLRPAASLTAPTPAGTDLFGSSAAIDGNFAVIGTPNKFVLNNGEAYIYNTITGNLVSTLVHPDPTGNDNLGNANAVAISRGLAVAGAWGHSPDGGVTEYVGEAYVYNAGDGTLVATLVNPDPDAFDSFGRAVAIDGNRVAVGARGDDPGAGASTGTAYVFNATTGALISTLTNPNPNASDFFGISVAIDGDRVAVGATGDNPGAGANTGRAYVLNVTTGALISTLTNPNPNSNDHFGNSIAMDGNRVIVGARGDDPGTGANTGRAYVFNATTGALISTLTNPNPNGSDEFGYSVDIEGDIAVVGAYGDTPAGAPFTTPGRAYVFDATTGILRATLDNPEQTTTFERFGSAVGISGETVIVGAQGSDVGATSDAGRAYVFGPGVCGTPERVAGTIIHNDDSNVLQYCDGEDWIAMGPVPGAGGTGCSNPAGDEGQLYYASDYTLMQYCDGSEWVSIGKKPDPCNDSAVAPGTVCNDGTIYAGLSPDGNVKMYTTPADTSGYTFNNSTTNWIDTAMANCTDASSPGTATSCRTGEANTAFLAGLADAASPYAAAVYCYTLEAHGHQDWYLPAMDELNEMFINRAAIGGFSTSVNTWSSSEYGSNWARVQSFVTGFQDAANKNAVGPRVRCVRKD